MRKKIGTLLIVGSLGALCAGLCACSHETAIDKYRDAGNIITVTYDASGGEILGGDNVRLVDMFNPDKYKNDGDGYVEIKLRDPNDPNRPQAGATAIEVSRSGYSLVGWYQTRTEVTNDKGEVVNEEGVPLVKRDDSYYLETEVEAEDGTKKKVEVKALPAYTYSDPWDFSEKHKFKADGCDMTLYAAWTKLFTFEYYYKPTAESEWTSFATTRFDPAIAAKKNDGRDSVYVPDWSATTDTGTMDHKHKQQGTNDIVYTFPSINNMTFKAAYYGIHEDTKLPDEAKKITGSHPHAGEIDYSNATATGSVQKIYVEFDKGNYYRITEASQFAKSGDPEGYYTILNDLDFKCDPADGGALEFKGDMIRWPLGLMLAEFKGSIEGEGGKTVKFKNVGAQYINNAATFGGLFGSIGSDAIVKNVTFENVTLDISTARSSHGAQFGTFAGNIDLGATVENVAIDGAEIRVGGDVNVSGTTGLQFNLIANGNDDGSGGRIVTGTGISITLYGKKVGDKFGFSFKPTGETTVDADGKINFAPLDSFSAYLFENQYYKVYQTENGGQGNE